ncbi:MAG: methyltransferase [Candidatus Kapabacteria bacterium]|nr:methyltransferase [Candidatus Kapabacteria bacterium]
MDMKPEYLTSEHEQRERLRKEFRSLVRAYAVARVTGRVALSHWPAVDAAVRALGGRLGFTPEEIKWMLTSRAVAVPLQDLLGAIDRLGDELTPESIGLADPERRSRLRTMFRELVALYVMTICAGKLNPSAEPHIDRKFSSIARVVEVDFGALKSHELAACRREEGADEATDAKSVLAPDELDSTPAPDESESTPVPAETVTVAARPRIESALPASDFNRLSRPYILETLARQAEQSWSDAKAAIEEVERRPEAWTGSQKDYLATVASELTQLREARDDAYRLFTATRNRIDLDSDADVRVVMAVQHATDELRRQHGGVLPREATQKALTAFEQRMRESRFYEHYPTPRHIIDGMLEYADIRPGNRVLEPSAGEGNIAGAIQEREPQCILDVVEFEPLLADILTLKGFNVVGSDFLAYNTSGAVKYDAIIMNPPFDKGVDIEHVYHAYSMLRDGGRLVAVTSGNAVDGTDEENYAFRDFLEKRGSWRMYAPKEYMGPAGKLTNGRQIGIVVAVCSITRPEGDTFGKNGTKVERSNAESGQFVYDTQGAQAYEVLEINDRETKVRNLHTGKIRTFKGALMVGGRFLHADSAEAAKALASADEDAPRDDDGRIILPEYPPAPKDGEPGLKPLRVVTSRQELMPSSPTANLFSERIASNVQLTTGQMDGINRALAAMDDSTGSFLLADGTGFGKTLQALVIAATIVERDKMPVLIFTKSPSIIETSFFDDARKLRIDTPDAQNVKDRQAFTGRSAAGMAIRKVSKIEDLAAAKLGADIYVASYHLFGRWDGDKREREELKTWKATRVDPLREEYSKRRAQIRRDARWMSAQQLSELLERINAEEDEHPVMIRARELREMIEAKNEAMFGAVGRRFAAVISDEAHAYKNYNPDDFNDGSYQAYRGMVLLTNAKRRLLATATPADKVEHVRYLKGLNVYKTEEQYKRLMSRLGFVWHEPEYRSGRIVRRGRFAFDSALPPEYVLNNISRLFENLTMAGTMIKRELSLDNFEARNIMIGGTMASPAEQAAV